MPWVMGDREQEPLERREWSGCTVHPPDQTDEHLRAWSDTTSFCTTPSDFKKHWCESFLCISVRQDKGNGYNTQTGILSSQTLLVLPDQLSGRNLSSGKMNRWFMNLSIIWSLSGSSLDLINLEPLVYAFIPRCPTPLGIWKFPVQLPWTYWQNVSHWDVDAS